MCECVWVRTCVVNEQAGVCAQISEIERARAREGERERERERERDTHTQSEIASLCV